MQQVLKNIAENPVNGGIILKPQCERLSGPESRTRAMRCFECQILAYRK